MLKRTLISTAAAAAMLAGFATQASAGHCTYWVGVYESAVATKAIKAQDALMGQITKARGLVNDGKDKECMAVVMEIDRMLEKSGEHEMVKQHIIKLGRQGRPVTQTQ